MGFVTVVIQLALLFVFSINCENTTVVDYPLNQKLFFTKIDTECLAYRYVPCRKSSMTPMNVIFQDEEMNDPNSFESNDTIKYDFQCISYQLIPCKKVSKNVILEVVDEQERLRKTRSIYSELLENCQETKIADLSLLATESYCLTSPSTDSEISQLISLENIKICNEKEKIITQQLNVIENEKFVLQRDNIALIERLDQIEKAIKKSEKNLEVCKGLAAYLTKQLADRKMEDVKAKEKIKAAADEVTTMAQKIHTSTTTTTTTTEKVTTTTAAATYSTSGGILDPSTITAKPVPPKIGRIIFEGSEETPDSEPKTITTTAENGRSASINLQIQEEINELEKSLDVAENEMNELNHTLNSIIKYRTWLDAISTDLEKKSTRRCKTSDRS